jgi:hypothetical protein
VVEEQVVCVRVEGGGQRGVEGCVGCGGEGSANVDDWGRDGPLTQDGAKEAHVRNLILWERVERGCQMTIGWMSAGEGRRECQMAAGWMGAGED